VWNNTVSGGCAVHTKKITSNVVGKEIYHLGEEMKRPTEVSFSLIGPTIFMPGSSTHSVSLIGWAGHIRHFARCEILMSHMF
jgi:hypothetical protein